MQGSVTRRGWASSRAWVALMVAAGIGCSGEAEVTTELPDGAPSELLGAKGNPASSGAGMRADGASQPDGSLGAARPTRSGSSGAAPAPGTSEDGADVNPAVALAPLDVPSGDYCAAVSDWDPAWVQFEQEVLLLVNQRRAQAADCGDEGRFGPAGPVVMEPSLRCSARLQSLDMFERGFFDHVNPDGLDPFQRMGAAGFHGSGAGENIAVGQTSPQQVMQSWMESNGHCANVMRPNYTMLGVGYHPGAGGRGLGSNFWTQNFGAPPIVRSCMPNCR